MSLWGLAAVCLVAINTLLVLYEPGIGNVLALLAPYAPYELVLGIWLMVKGFTSSGSPMGTISGSGQPG